MIRLAVPELGRPRILAWLQAELPDLVRGQVAASEVVGGQQAADAALAAFDVTGYAGRRNQVWPVAERGASRLSPYIRHGFIRLRRAWDHVAGGPPEDVAKFRDELRWQEFARHLYARLGSATAQSLRWTVPEFADRREGNPWQTSASCIEQAWTELQSVGWITNQQRMWLASHWAVRHRRGWRDGEDLFFGHLLDGSRAANRLGWQWTSGALTGKPYGFSRWQVDRRAPGLCRSCPLEHDCPIEDWPPDHPQQPRSVIDPRMRRELDLQSTAGPSAPEASGRPEAVWITAESLGDQDPALSANPLLPVIFVFDEPLLRGLRLSTQRLVFLAEGLADLAQRRELHVWLGRPTQVLSGVRLAATFTPVPGWRQRSASLDLTEVHPWPWLMTPGDGSVSSFSAWVRAVGDRP